MTSMKASYLNRRLSCLLPPFIQFVSKISRTKLKSEERKKERKEERNEKQRQKSRLKFSIKTFVTISVKRFSSQTRNLVFQGS